MEDTNESETTAQSGLTKANNGLFGGSEARQWKWMCRVLHDGTVYETTHAMAKYCVDDKVALESATKDNPVVNWAGGAVYWRERRATGDDQQGLLQEAA